MVSDTGKRVLMLGKTVPGSQHDYSLFKEEFDPNEICWSNVHDTRDWGEWGTNPFNQHPANWAPEPAEYKDGANKRYAQGLRGQRVLMPIDTINGKVVDHDTKIKDLYVADATLVKKITKNETDIENDKVDISVLKHRVTKVENDSNLLRYYQIGDSGLTYQTKKQKKYRATTILTKNAGTDNNNFAINSATIADRKIINDISGDIYVNIPKSEITNVDSDFKINIISSLFSSNVILDAPYGIFFNSLTADESNYKLHFTFDSTYLSNFELSVGSDTMNVEFYFEILQ